MIPLLPTPAQGLFPELQTGYSKSEFFVLLHTRQKIWCYPWLWKRVSSLTLLCTSRAILNLTTSLLPHYTTWLKV